MLKKTITYTDYNGNERTEDFFFHLTKAELMELEASEKGGLEATIEKIINETDYKKLVELFKGVIVKAYGVKDTDGRRFIKSPELVESFTQTEAYSQLFMELALDTDAAVNFINGIVPQQ